MSCLHLNFCNHPYKSLSYVRFSSLWKTLVCSICIFLEMLTPLLCWSLNHFISTLILNSWHISMFSKISKFSGFCFQKKKLKICIFCFFKSCNLDDPMPHKVFKDVPFSHFFSNSTFSSIDKDFWLWLCFLLLAASYAPPVLLVRGILNG